MTTNLEIPIGDAIEDFLEERKSEVSASSHRNYKYPLDAFSEFCNDRGIETTADLNGYELKKFKLRRRDAGIKEVTLKNNLSVIRVFLRWCAEAELVQRGLADLVQIPDLETSEKTSGEIIPLDQIEEMLDYLYKYEYATRTHAAFQLMWHTCMRMGSLESIDLKDWHPDRNQIELHHRPDSDTPLKNGEDGERIINVSDTVTELLEDYIEGHRKAVTDDYGREPMFTTRYGRLTHNTLRKNIYGITRPCYVGMGCPHDKDPSECEAANYKKKASKCPSSMSPHPVRRSAITYHLNQEWPKEKLSERANVSVSVLDEHYDGRTKQEEASTRKQYLDNLGS
jgi:site-specific recombinase XerD